jgi:hypothetical protein
MSFQYIENILSEELLAQLSRYCNMDNHDETHWFLKARYRSSIDQSDVLLIVEHLMKNKQSPFYKDRRLLTKHQIHINKLGPGGALPPHTDTVCGSLTVFLNEEWSEDDGGLFVWTDVDGEQHSVVPKYNCGVWDRWDIPTTGSLHEVTVSNKPRYSLQVFYGIGNNEINIGVTPEDVDLSLYAKDIY